MTNYEYYKEVLIGITAEGLALQNGKPVLCGYIECEDCDLGSCIDEAAAWLLQEHTLKPKITRSEFEFTKILNPGYIARDKSGSLFWFNGEVEKHTDSWQFKGVADPMCLRISRGYFNIPDPFSFITWEDEEPWSVEDLRKLEVIE